MGDIIARRALAARERLLMSDHPEIVESLRTSAAILWALGRDIEAEAMAERARSIDWWHGMDRPDPTVSD